MKWDIFISCLAVCFHIKWTESAIVVTSNNAVVLVGGHLTLNCSSNKRDNLRWYKDCEFCSGDAVATDNAIPPYHAHDKKKRTAALVESSVTMAEAGSYTCWSDMEARGVSLEVVVLATHPRCTISSTAVRESDLVTMSCSVVYKGHLTPMMTWKTSEGLIITSTRSSIQFGSAVRLTYTASVVATSYLHGIRFHSKTFFGHPSSDLNPSAECDCTKKSPVPVSASNIPTYSYSWTSSALSVSSNRLPAFNESHQLRVKRASSNTPKCDQTVYVGNEILLGQDGYQCNEWTVSTPTTSEHYVSDHATLGIADAKLAYAGLYKCYVNKVLKLSCQVTVTTNWGLGDHNVCGVDNEQDLSCSAQSSDNLEVKSGKSLYGICQVTGSPAPYILWMFCPNVCGNMYLSNITSSDSCQPVDGYNESLSSDFVKSNVKSDGSGLYVCTATYLDATAAVYNVCVNVDPSDCSGTSVRWWHWYQAAVAIVTVDIIAAICFLVLVIVIWVDNDTTITFCSRLLLIVLNHCVLLILAAMIFIGCAICLARDSDKVAVKWETGVLVMFVLLFFFGILSAIVTGLFRCTGKVHLIVVIVWDIVTILVALATLIWTLINMSRCRSVQRSGYSGEWSWEIFLIALGIALFVCVLSALLWYIRRKKHCTCCGGKTVWDCHFSSRRCCACGDHGSRERIRVESGSEINRHHTERSMQTGCFCGCCKRKIGNNPELVSQTHRTQVEHKKAHGVRGPPSPERNPVEITKTGHHYKGNDHYQNTQWVCCAANSCCKRPEQRRLRDGRRDLGQREPTTWVCCPGNSCCRPKARGKQRPISESGSVPVEWEMPDNSCGKCCLRSCGLSCVICCCSCCKSCNGKGKKSNKKDKVNPKDGEKKCDKKPDARNDKNKEKNDKSKIQEEEKEAKDHKDDKIKAEKELKTKNSKKPNGKADSDDDRSDDEKEKNGKERGAKTDKDHKKHGKDDKPGSKADKDDDGRGDDDHINAKKEDKLLRAKVDKDPLLPPLLGSIELQEGPYSQRQVKRFLPPKRVLAASVVGDDRSMTPVTPGRDDSPERVIDSSRKSKKPNKEESKEGRKKNTHREELGASSRL